MTTVSPHLLKKLLELFPPKISYAFAYGSGVFSQSLDSLTSNELHLTDEKTVSTPKQNMIDLVLAVDDPIDWHSRNLARNRCHYSSIRYLGPKFLTGIQESFGAKVYYNTLIPVDDYLIKYGVISTKHLIDDLLDWETLYISGRLHKPVFVIKEAENDSELKSALTMNLKSALHSALILLPESFTEEKLFYTISEISYIGDVRMTFFEDRYKVSKIVRPHIKQFRSLYHPIIVSDSMRNIMDWNANAMGFRQDKSPRMLLHHLNLLPKNVQNIICDEYQAIEKIRDNEDILQSISQAPECQTLVLKAVRNIVWQTSVSQTLKGLLTAGFYKSLQYTSKKLMKMLNSRF